MLKKTYRFRLLLLACLSLITFGAIWVRLVILQVRDHAKYRDRARDNQHKAVQLSPRRGDILDRNGRVLATSHMLDQVTIDGSKLKGLTKDKRELLATELSGVFEMMEPTVLRYLSTPGQHILYRKASAELTSQTRELMRTYKIPSDAIFFPSSSQREYPNHTLASHVVGFTKIDDTGDNVGDAGIELSYDKWLRGQYTKGEVPVNASQRQLAPLDDEVFNGTFGANVVLTIDRRVQTFAEQAISRGVGNARAKAGVAVVMDVPTGEILALANFPDFDPSLAHEKNTKPDSMKNRVLTDPIEIGSVMKIITASLLLDNNLLSVDETINCHDGEYSIGKRRIKDDHPLGTSVPFRQAFAESSNIALATLGLRLDQSLYFNGLTRFGIGTKSGIDLRGESRGTMPSGNNGVWGMDTRISLPIGYEVGVTAMQVVSALQAIGNDGVRMRPHLVKEIRSHSGQVLKRFDPEPLDRAVSEETARTVRSLMEGVVLGGTGTEAQVPGYIVGGKTGTTAKSDKKKEDRLYVAGFAGLLPIDNPRIAVYVYLDEPQNGIYGGKLAAPVFREIALQTAPILDIAPSDPAALVQARAILNGAGIDNGTTTITVAALTQGAKPGRHGSAKATPTPAPATIALPVAMTRPKVTGGRPMPQFKGETIDEVWGKLGEAGISGQVLGSGIVVRQEPSAQTPVAPGEVVTIILAHPSDPVTTGTAMKSPAQGAEAKKPLTIVPHRTP